MTKCHVAKGNYPSYPVSRVSPWKESILPITGIIPLRRVPKFSETGLTNNEYILNNSTTAGKSLYQSLTLPRNGNRVNSYWDKCSDLPQSWDTMNSDNSVLIDNNAVGQGHNLSNEKADIWVNEQTLLDRIIRKSIGKTIALTPIGVYPWANSYHQFLCHTSCILELFHTDSIFKTTWVLDLIISAGGQSFCRQGSTKTPIFGRLYIILTWAKYLVYGLPGWGAWWFVEHLSNTISFSFSPQQRSCGISYEDPLFL